MIIGIGTQGSHYGYGTNGAWITVELGLNQTLTHFTHFKQALDLAVYIMSLNDPLNDPLIIQSPPQ